ncbi:KEOPS complex subunit Cgi121 [Halorientalis regularis]|jgi:KEOPS complex subunit Cgi121|uniref:KEOPS complex subunit Cgi121 n=1 Tax=Halorientalis regularis TaxID=660518 RepID=A0A1G7K283_9EURY|nr:KEOPS complex subunit Cgi121 [Halorientalis regularis]SDF31101.1 KEOPS complex subunit Cgi121 [Halorientalis regularis]
MEVIEGTATVEDVDAFVATLGEIGDEHGCAVQAFDARYVVGRDHLERAVACADRARAQGEAIADDHAVEILLYAAGRRQISQALEMGVAEGECPVAVLVHGVTESANEGEAAAAVTDLLEPAETLSAYDEERVRDFFGVSDRELAATDAGLAALVGERVALLSVEK